MKNKEFAKFMALLDVDMDYIEHCGYLWLTLTNKQIARVIDYYRKTSYGINVTENKIEFGSYRQYCVPVDEYEIGEKVTYIG